MPLTISDNDNSTAKDTTANSTINTSKKGLNSALLVGSNSTDMSLGRHILLKALYDGEEVVLKGFVMRNFAQRKGICLLLYILYIYWYNICIYILIVCKLLILYEKYKVNINF